MNRNNQEFIKLTEQIKMLSIELFMTPKSPYYNMININNINDINNIQSGMRINSRKLYDNKLDRTIGQIDSMYKQMYFGKMEEIPETDPLIQLYQLRIFNIQNKKKLENLVKENGSLDEILLKLKSLYKEKILFIENNF